MATTTKLVELFNADETIAALSTQAFVEAAYENLLGLSGDFSNKDARVAYWVAKIDAGLATADFAATFLAAAAVQGDLLTDAEFAVNTATLVAVAALDETDLTLAAVKAAAVAAVEESEAETPDANAGETFTLTTGADSLAPLAEDAEAEEGVSYTTAKDDTFEGVASALTAEQTLGATDAIDGGEGTDTLKVDLKANFSGFSGAGKLANVEKVELTNSGTIGRTFDATGVTGVEEYTLNTGESSIALSNLAAAGVTVNVNEQASGTATIGYTTAAVSGSSDALTLGLNSVGTAQVKDAAGTVTAATKYVTATATGIENLTVNATGDNFVNLSGAATKTITAAGEGSLDIEAVGTVTAFDAAEVAGNVTADLTGAAATSITTVATGAGDDTVTLDLGDLTANATISGGEGTNHLKVSGSGTVQPTLSQFQTIELNGIDGSTTLSGKNISDVSTLLLKGNGLATNALTVAGLPTAALTVKAEGAQNSGSVTLTAATDLTYTTQAVAATTAAKGQDNVQTVVSAGEATNATINVGAYTKQSGNITVAKATALTLNVESGKTAAATPVEQTVFDAELTANAAQSITVNAEGTLGSTASKTITGSAATLLDVTANGGGDMEFVTVKAQQVNITAGAALDIQNSDFSAAEQVTLAANVGHLDGNGVNLAKISTLTISGAGSTSGKESQVTLANLGSATDITNAITVTATGLKGGATVGTIDTKGGNVTINATEMSGNFVAGNIGSGANKTGNVTINAATLGSTKVGTIDTVANATVAINATGLLGKDGSDNALTVGATAVSTDSNKNTGTITAEISGSNGLSVGSLKAKSVTVDASGYLGGNITGTQIGTITGQAVTIKGSELGQNTFTVDLQQHADETTGSATVTGGLQNDKLVVSNTSLITSAEAYTISFTGGEGSDTIEFAGTTTDLTHASSKLTLTGIEALTATKALTVKAADVTGLTLTVTPTETFTVKGTDSADTIDLSGITGALTVQGGKGADTIKLKSDNATADTVVFEATASDNGSDTITGFTAGSDKINLAAFETVGTLVDGTTTYTVADGQVVYLFGQAAGAADSSAAAITALNAAGTVTDAAATNWVVISDDNSTAIYQFVNDNSTNEYTGATATLVGTLDVALAASTDIVIA